MTGARLLGLRDLVARSAPDECPFCGDPRATKPPGQQNGGRPGLTCGDEICKAAYHRYYGRDRKRPVRSRAEKDRYNAVKRAAYAARKARTSE